MKNEPIPTICDAFAIQMFLVGNDLLNVEAKFARGESPLPEDAAIVNLRAGRMEGLLFALSCLWPQEKFLAFAKSLNLGPDELPVKLAEESEKYRAVAGEVMVASSATEEAE